MPKYYEMIYYFAKAGYSVYMVEHRGHGFYIHAVLQRHRCEGVAEVVKADAGQPRPFQHSLQHMQDAVW